MSSPSLCRYQVVSDTVRRFNEDVGSVVDGAAWVLDGATGITDTTHTDSPSDGHWYVQQFDDYLREHVTDSGRSLTEVVADGIESVGSRFDTVTTVDDIDVAAEPSATAAIVRWTDRALEYYVLCDSTFLQLEDTSVQTVETDARIERFEERAREAVRGLKSSGAGLEEAREEVMPTLLENRRQKNSQGTYWVLSLNSEAAARGITGETRLTAATTVYLFTDGFGRLVDTYDVHPDWDTGIQSVERDGLETTVETIREIEREDAEGDDHLRLKQSDDATAVKLSFGPVS